LYDFSLPQRQRGWEARRLGSLEAKKLGCWEVRRLGSQGG